MKTVQINTLCGVGSTGKICVLINEILEENDIENHILYSSGKSNHKNSIKYSNKIEIKISTVLSRIFGNWGFENYLSTRRLIKYLNKLKPEIIHLHNIHSHACNLKMLFSWIKKNKAKVIWTFHDCWAFTAYCPHFMLTGCNKWESGCETCGEYRKYSLLFNRSKELSEKKRKLLNNNDMVIVCPSEWLANKIKTSFLKHIPVTVIHNGVDLSVFKPIKSDFRKKHSIDENKKLLLGVSFGWDYSKGLDTFCDLARKLDDRFVIVLVGTDDKVDANLPDNIISIHKTSSQVELAEIYSSADIFINPTRQDTFPTVNMEAIACGTPVITFDVGGSPEIIDDNTGLVIEKYDINCLIEGIESVAFSNKFSTEKCLQKAKEFDKRKNFKQYLNIYKSFYND